MGIQKVGVVGAGTMGSGIAQACAVAGLDVVLIDVSDEALQCGIAGIVDRLQVEVDRNKLVATRMARTLSRIRATTDMGALNQADVVIESATENLALKLRLLKDIDAVASHGTMLATNTSSISITQLAAAIPRPESVVGIHFFNPAPAMALVEVIRGAQTSEATYVRATDFAKALGKFPVSVGDSPGFVVNRILCPMINEAILVLQEDVASAQDIDIGMKLGCHHPVGPLALADIVGLDVILAIMEILSDGFKDSKYRPAPLLKEMVAAGHLGRKSGRGFYDYATSPGTK